MSSGTDGRPRSHPKWCWDAKNYYHYIVIQGLTQTYSWSDDKRQFIQPYSKVTNGTLFV